jgi:glycolate oxidase FAD binding subunit
MSQHAASVTSRLADLVGVENLAGDPAGLSRYAVDGLTPSAALRPGSTAEIAEILRFAAAGGLALIPTGRGSKLGIGIPPRKYDLALDVSRMNRVLAYDPGDLTLGVEPGAPYAEVARQLAAGRQFLPLAPAFAARATIGGIVAAGADSPLRHGYGGIRDYLRGMEFVTGAGVISKSGGRVVKNVTGYDLHKLLVGSLGTLAVITRINFRTFPIPPEKRVFSAAFGEAANAWGLCERLAKSQLQPKMVEVLSPSTRHIFAACGGRPCWCVVITAAGEHAAVKRHAREIEGMAREERAIGFDSLDEAPGNALLAAIREFPRVSLEAFPGAVIFRIAALPSTMPALAEQIGSIGERHECETAILARAAGVIYAALLARGAGAEQRLAACRELMSASLAAGARPMIEWCPLDVKRALSVWPPPGDEQALAQRIKKVFDPQGVLAPGRFLGGI